MAASDSKRILACGLTYAGALPFMAILLLQWLPMIDLPVNPRLLFFSYAALIASFICGIHWGVYLLKEAPFNLFLLSNLITLIAWSGIFLNGFLSGITLLGCFAFLLAIDWGLFKAGILERWYFNLRLGISIVVMLALSASVFIF